MKQRQSVGRKSPFWSRLLGLLITFAIIAVLVFGGVKNLMSDLSDAHKALATSQYELGRTENELATTQHALAAVHNELAGKSRALQQSAKLIDIANNRILALNNERNRLKHRWGSTLRALAQRNEQYITADRALRATQDELKRLRQQPQWSMIVTTERQLQMSHRERYAMSHARMMFQGDAGTMYYEGMAALHEIEKHVAYAERTQVIWTQTAPGHNVLDCLADESKGCTAVVAARVQAVQMQAYSYQSQFRGMEMLLME